MARTKEEILKQLLDKRIKFATVSGIFTTKPDLIDWCDQHLPEIEVITSKSFQVIPTEGNREPIIVETKTGCFGNAVGLRNPGMDKAYKELTALRKKRSMNSLLNVSLAASSIEDYLTLVKKFEDIADILEFNFSCPHAHAGFGSSIGSDAGIVSEYVKEIRKNTKALIFPKLTPNVENIGEIAREALKAGADGIVAINTVGPEAFLEPHTQQPVLYNPNGHKGGKSGDWILPVALEKVREIRAAVGSDCPIIGMGGISSGEDVRKMIDAGANVVGVGSVLARVSIPSTPAYVQALKHDAETGNNNAISFVSQKRIAEYSAHKINKIIDKTADLRIFELDGKLEYQASEFAFLWVPGEGEKPFSVALSDPLTFVVRKRVYEPENKKGLVTHALFQLKEGEELMVRGVYGQDAPVTEKPEVCIITGGTGVAVVPKLAQKLQNQGKKVTVYYGVTSEEQIVLAKEMSEFAEVIPVCDDGVIGRVLQVFEKDLSEKDVSQYSFYNVGPVPMMKGAMDIQEKLGSSTENIFSSLEMNTLCGIGMCGECNCGGHLTCRQGTFLSLSHLKKHDINIMDFAH